MSTQNWSEDPIVPVSPAHGSGDPDGGQSSSANAKDEAKNLGHEGADAAKGVAQTAGSEAKNVAGEASAQAKNLLGELGSDLKDQAGASQQKAAEGLRSISDELSSMADNGDQNGPANNLVRQAAQRSGDVAGWLEGRDPGSLLEEAKGFARRRPGTFLMVAAGAGLLAGRLTRGLAGAGSDDQNATPANPAPEYPPTVPTQPTTEDGFGAPTTATPVTTSPGVVDTDPGVTGREQTSASDPLADPLAAEPIIEPGRQTQSGPLDRDVR
ncbi:hypothetical protein [Arthrobacter sp. H20]|uniref:hypothetical protein n=1 Tax=Arthrobacter sp. H20 TaxID=1267981 RepID=UPI0004ADFF97|nr:hypothetical protein [Arthrobacter sp. H20]